MIMTPGSMTPGSMTPGSMAAGGQSAFGRFRIDGVLGQGAMSVVYRASDPTTGDTVALKVLRAELLALAERSAVLARFEREARIGMRLSHPNIVRVHDHGIADGSPWLAMEMIVGRELKDFMEAEPPLPIPKAVGVITDVLDALGYAHARGVIHRDVKPANIVLRPDLTPKLTDFGIARVPSSDVTQAGDLLGTPAYVAPEQLRGEEADQRSDLFSMGVILYYLLTRRRPFSGTVAVVMQRILFADPALPSSVDPRVSPVFDPVIMRALAKHPGDRYGTAAELAADLKAALAALSGPAPAAAVSAIPAEDRTMRPADIEALVDDIDALLRAAAAAPIGERRLSEFARLLDDALVCGADRGRLSFVLAESGVTPVGALILAGVPAPRASLTGRRPDWMALVRLFARMKAGLGALGAADRAAGLTARIATELSTAVLLYSNELNRELMVDDNPDMTRISADFMRLDILLMALEELGAETELRTARATLTMFAGQVMRKVNSILRACTEGNDGFARFGMAVILSDIEELIVMASRVVEGGPGGAGFQAIGQEILVEFVTMARRFAALSAEELRGAGHAAAADTTFAAKLRPLGALYAFATRLPAAGTEGALQALTGDLHALVGSLTHELASAPVADDHVRVRLDAVCDMAETLGWSAIEAEAAGALRRWAMAAGRAT